MEFDYFPERSDKEWIVKFLETPKYDLSIFSKFGARKEIVNVEKIKTVILHFIDKSFNDMIQNEIHFNIPIGNQKMDFFFGDPNKKNEILQKKIENNEKKIEINEKKIELNEKKIGDDIHNDSTVDSDVLINKNSLIEDDPQDGEKIFSGRIENISSPNVNVRKPTISFEN